MNAIRPIRRQDDEFFTNGDFLSHKNSDIILSYIRDSHDHDGTHHMKQDKEPEHALDPREPTYPCCAPHCNQSFHSIFECENHYNAHHTFECKECKCVLPNEFLLDLHLQEAHDAYFQTLLQHKKASYPCLIMNCKERFPSLIERFRHLQLVHGYPKWFRFHSRAKKQKQKQKQKQVQITAPNKEKRRQRRKERNKNKPCRYYHSKSGCRRGDKCMFLHDDRPSPMIQGDDHDHEPQEEKQLGTQVEVEAECEGGASPDVDVEMDELANQMDAKARISVPAKISFGRRRR